MPSFAILACEPVLPLTMLMMPWTAAAMLVGLAALFIVVVVKCAAFAFLQRGAMSAPFAVLTMFVANIVSTIAGFFAALTFAAPSAFVVGFLAAIVVSILPARRLSQHVPKLKTSLIIVVMGALYVGSVILFLLAQQMALGANLVAYWALKYAYIVCGLLISMGLTTFWEEYVIWRMSGHENFAFVTPVFRANAIALFLIMLAAAIAVLPQRLRSPDFLIALLFR